MTFLIRCLPHSCTCISLHSYARILSQALLDLAKKKEPLSTDEVITILGHLASALERYCCGSRCGLVQLACRLSYCELVFHLRFVHCCYSTSGPRNHGLTRRLSLHLLISELVILSRYIWPFDLHCLSWRPPLVAITYDYSRCFDPLFIRHRLAPPGFKHCL